MVLAAILIFDIFLLVVGHHDAFEVALKVKLIPLAMILLAMIRLGRKRLGSIAAVCLVWNRVCNPDIKRVPWLIDLPIKRSALLALLLTNRFAVTPHCRARKSFVGKSLFSHTSLSITSFRIFFAVGWSQGSCVPDTWLQCGVRSGHLFLSSDLRWLDRRAVSFCFRYR